MARRGSDRGGRRGQQHRPGDIKGGKGKKNGGERPATLRPASVKLDDRAAEKGTQVQEVTKPAEVLPQPVFVEAPVLEEPPDHPAHNASSNGHIGNAETKPEHLISNPEPPAAQEQGTVPAEAVTTVADDVHAPTPELAEGTGVPVDEKVEEEKVSEPPLFFEVAWEVCWQLGGIYTVLKTKVDAMLRRWDDRYCLIGPYNPSTAAIEFEERPTDGYIRQALDRLREAGIPCHYGRWLVPGRPRVILLDYRARYGSSDSDKYYMWKDHGIPTYASDGEVNDVVAFGFTVAEFFKHLTSIVTDRPILAQFHEWMGGVAVPRIAHMRLPVATVFTTHATILGRYLASDDPHFYDHLNEIHADAAAEHYRIFPRYAIEKAAAHASTVFTTVSEVTAREAEALLGRRADVILPNGLQLTRFAAIHEFQNLHRQFKERINEFVMGHFFPSYSFDLDRTLYMFTSGRYEYLNKGMDLYIEAMWRLNQRLKQIPDPPTVVSFIITKAQVRSVNVQALQNQAMFDELRATCDDISEQMGKRLFQAAANGRLATRDELLPDDAQVRLKRTMHAWRSHRQPLIVTHDLADDGNDPILKHVRHRWLVNAADDPVKMVFHPQFVTATGPLINLDYEQFVRGCHLGIFPSYYEPWGYTPMESVAMGVPAITTDLSGFGAYVQRHLPQAQQQGIVVVNRSTKRFDETADELANYLFEFVQLNRRQRIELRNRVERMSEMFDWSVLARHYDEAHDLALNRIGAPARVGRLEIRTV